MPDFSNIKYIYFLGIGGIGMSALARLFAHQGHVVAGYDRTRTPLTTALENEGISVHYEDDVNLVPKEVLDNRKETLIIYTPAVPKEHTEYNYFLGQGFSIIKRAKALGVVSRSYKSIAVAGTHGKTTTSTLIAHILKQSSKKADAILGGISTNYNTNLLLNVPKPELFVTEADEYDRSFLQLNPYTAVITSIDADHLDIYGSHAEMKVSFAEFAALCRHRLVLHKQVFTHFSVEEEVDKVSYAVDMDADFSARNLRVEQGEFYFDLHFEDQQWKNIRCGVPGIHNVENATAAIAAVIDLGLNEEEIRNGIASFQGVKRRFEYILRKENFVFIDDYAHHPTELEACIRSVKKLYPGKKILGVFQPHLYSRTRDFAAGFSQSLNLLDEVILLDIYPAREEPIPGITSEIIYNNITIPKTICKKSALLDVIKNKQCDVLLTLGAGDIDTLVQPLKQYFEHEKPMA